jgi:hypothetical protein
MSAFDTVYAYLLVPVVALVTLALVIRADHRIHQLDQRVACLEGKRPIVGGASSVAVELRPRRAILPATTTRTCR